MLTRTQQRQFVAVALVVVGLLLLIGSFSLGLLVVLAAIAAVALGIVLLLENRQEPRVLGIVLLVLGALLLLADRFFSTVVDAINLLGGLAMVAAGVWLLWTMRNPRPSWR